MQTKMKDVCYDNKLLQTVENVKEFADATKVKEVPCSKKKYKVREPDGRGYHTTTEYPVTENALNVRIEPAPRCRGWRTHVCSVGGVASSTY